jgi:putative two-component system response regulator
VVMALSAAGSIALVRRYNAMLVKMNEDLSKEVDRQVASATKIRNGIIMGLAKLADHRDNETGRHLERIRTYCEMLAHELRGTFDEIDDAWTERLSVTSTMHDIGKVGIPDSVLLKPGRLTDAERRVMERHPLIGADTLVEVRRHVGEDDLVDMATEISLYHHEKWDGSGYPFGLGTTEIPLSARIVALADVYDALTSWRVYKKAMSHEEAKKIILGGRGEHFDPAIVDAFERIESKFDEVRQTMDEDNVMALRIAPDSVAA